MTRVLTWLQQCRLFEWVTTFVMLGWAVTIVIWPDTITIGAFRWMLVAGFTPLVLGLFFAIVGGIRISALVVNGRSELWGPRLRAFGAVAGGIIWAWLAIALIFLVNETSAPSPGIWTYLGLMLGEIVSCTRAAADVRINRHR